MAYVMRRSGGFRDPMPTWWPGELRDLISRCWAQDPADRPSFAEVGVGYGAGRGQNPAVCVVGVG